MSFAGALVHEARQRRTMCKSDMSKDYFESSFQAVGQDLLDNEAILEAVNQDARDLLLELKQGEGLVDMLGFEEQLRLVNETWNEAKFQVHNWTSFRFFLWSSYSYFGKALFIQCEKCWQYSYHTNLRKFVLWLNEELEKILARVGFERVADLYESYTG